MDKTEKQEVVASLHRMFADAETVVVARYNGMTVAEINDLRNQIRQAGARFRVAKNRLARRALEGTKFKTLDDLFTGPSACAFSKDPVAAAKVVVNYAKSNGKLVVVGGAFGPEKLSVEGVKTLAALPSLDQLRGKLVGLLQAPATRIASVLKAPAGQLARVLNARSQQQEGGASA